MAIYNYTLPSGARYVVDAPAGTTQAQADYVFYSQVAVGSLVGYTRGQTLSSAATKLTKFELSRLDRGTAGVDSSTILAITSPSNNIPLRNPITVADFAAVGPTAAVGPLTPSETQAVIAQIANLVDQPFDEISTEEGIGEYGLGTPQLEQAGYLKPGTSNYPDFNCAVSSPSVWTGKDGVYSLTDILNDPALQTQMQTQVMQNSYNALTSAGTIQEPTTAPATVSTGQIYTNNGLSTLTAASLVTGTAALASNFNSIISASLTGANNISNFLSNPVTNISTLASGAVNTVTQSIAGLGASALATANNLVNSTISNTVGQATALIAGVSNSITGAVGGLIANASQFGAPVTALWAQGQGLLSGASGLATGALGGLTTLASGALGSAQGLVTGALGDLTTLASGALGTVTGQASALLGSLSGTMDVFGKMSSFSVDFNVFSSDSLVSPTKVAAGYSNTVNRSVVDAATTRILGDAKIPVPQFQYPSPGALNVGADINFAQNALKSLTSPFTNAVAQAQGAFTQATQLATNAQTAINRLTG